MPRHAYGASKAGLDILTRCMAAELGPQGLRFVTLARDTAKSKGFSGVFSNEFADEFAAAATDEENRYDALHRDSFRVRLVHRAASRDAMRGC